MTPHADPLQTALLDELAEVVTQHFAIQPRVLLDVVERDLAIALDERHHQASELVLAHAAIVDGLLLLGLLLFGLRVGVLELVLEDARLLALLRAVGGLGRWLVERVSEVPEGDLRELGPQPARVEIGDQILSGLLRPLRVSTALNRSSSLAPLTCDRKIALASLDM